MVTSRDLPELTEDDRRLSSALADRGFLVAPAIWDRRDIEWKRFDLALIRSPWDYFRRRGEFFRWLADVEPIVSILNAPSVLRWNSDKRYLLQLASDGIPIVPSVVLRETVPADLDRTLDSLGCECAVIKPTISGASWRLSRVHKGDPRAQGQLEALLRHGEALVQPFVSNVLSSGETSLIFIDGRFSHAVRKLPARDDFRVQAAFGGSERPVEPSAEFLAAAHDAIDAVPSSPLYARVDLIEGQKNEPLLMELEVLDPDLMFRHAATATEQMADAIAGRVTRSRTNAQRTHQRTEPLLMNSTHDDSILRYSAFTESPQGGNPAGVVLDARALTDQQMLAIAADVGYSETAFLTARPAGSRQHKGSYDVKYFSPEAEVPFCGHATIAAAVALADRQGPGDIIFHIGGGEVPVRTRAEEGGRITATLTSVSPQVFDAAADDVKSALALLGWSRGELDPALPPMIAYAGARHLIIAAATRGRLAQLDYDFEGLKAFMLSLDLTTVDLVWREDQLTFHARNPFPVGGVVEDPATGAAAAAFGAYLREVRAVTPPAGVTILQGQDMGRPSELLVDIDAGRAEIEVTGRAVPIPG